MIKEILSSTHIDVDRTMKRTNGTHKNKKKKNKTENNVEKSNKHSVISTLWGQTNRCDDDGGQKINDDEKKE